jgi:hypothetical protein
MSSVASVEIFALNAFSRSSSRLRDFNRSAEVHAMS